jgi:hypothetical protein
LEARALECDFKTCHDAERNELKDFPESGKGLRNWTPKVTAFAVVGSVATVLFMISASELWKHDFRSAVWYLAFGAVLTLIFFRSRKIAFIRIALSFICVNAGFTALFHPTPAGVLLTLGSMAGMFGLAVWAARKYPYLARKHSQKVVDGDAAMAAENARIEAEARELVKKRPFGPWLFR